MGNVTLAMLLLIIMSASPCYGEQINIPALYGKTPSELTGIFPGIAGVKAEGVSELTEWRGWKTVYLNFNAKRRLTSITFVPAHPLSEEEAKRIIENEFSVFLPAKNEVRAPALIAYRNMKFNIRTVNFSYVKMNTDKRIAEIGIFFSLAWNE